MAALGVLLANAALVIWFIIRKRNKGLFLFFYFFKTATFSFQYHHLEMVESNVCF